MKKTNSFILDTNILISAFLFSSESLATQVYNKARGNISFSEETFNEFCDVFIRPKFDRYVPLDRRLLIIEDLKTLLHFTPIITSIQVCRDPKDDKYLELAVSSGAACIITGDKDLLVLNPFNDIPILSAADFLKTF